MIKKLKQLVKPLLIKAPILLDIYHKTKGVSAAILRGFPSAKMIIIGITGTNGKTTVANMLGYILEANKDKVGLATTINIWTGNRKWVNETKMTTLTPFALQGLLRQMVNQKCKYAIVETTSHALSQHRTWGIFYDIAIFTNLTHDHLDYHKTLENYKIAKGLLFKNLATSLRKPNMPKIAIINADDITSDYFKSFPSDKTYTFAIDNIDTLKSPDQSVWADNITLYKNATDFTLNTPSGKIDIRLKILGRFNISNALAAASAAYSLGISLPVIKTGLESMWKIPGRMEHVANNLGLNIIIDYAHTPDGFQKVLESVRPITDGNLIVVFGATGDRDASKRPTLGTITSQFADYIILTEEDPGSEDPQKIINQILEGIDKHKFQSHNLKIIIDRKEAIKHGLKYAKPNDTILLLAIGAQTVMIKNGQKIPYNEREVVESIMQTMS